MLKKTIKFKDYEGKDTEVVAYFNFEPQEIMDLNLEFEKEGGLIGRLNTLMEEKINGEPPRKPIVDFVSMMVEKSFGVRPKDDPTLFLKEDEDGRPYSRRFKQSLAYKTFVWALLTGEEPLDEFTKGIMPPMPEGFKDEDAEKAIKEQAPALYEITSKA